MLLGQLGAAFNIGEEEGDGASGEFIHWLSLMPTQWLIPSLAPGPLTISNRIVFHPSSHASLSTAHRNRPAHRDSWACRLFHAARLRRRTIAGHAQDDSARGR